MTTIFSLNVRGLNMAEPRRQILTTLHRRVATSGLLALQETRIDPLLSPSVPLAWGGQSFWSPPLPGDGGAGVAILVAPGFPFPVSLVPLHPSFSGRVICVRVATPTPFLFYSIYMPHCNFRSKQVLLDFLSFLPRLPVPLSEDIVLAGDWNCVAEPALDSSSHGHPDTYFTTHLDPLLQRWRVTDSFRHQHPTLPIFSRRPAIGHTARRLDRIYVSVNLIPLMSSTWIDPDPPPSSDHCVVGMRLLDQSSAAFGPSTWRFDPSQLSDTEFTTAVRSAISILLAESPATACPILLWSRIKLVPRLCSTTLRHSRILEARASLSRITTALASTHPQSSTYHSLQNYRDRVLGDLRVASRSFSSSRSDYLAAGMQESPSRSFFRSFGSPRAASALPDFRDPVSGIASSDPRTSLKIASSYYSKLYDSPTTDRFATDALLAGLSARLPPQLSTDLDIPLTAEELDETVARSPRFKAPGLDGLPYEFYSFFWDVLRRPFLAMAQASFLRGSFDEVQKCALLRLLHKKGDPHDPAKYRPIALQCTDVKLIMSVIAKRLNRALPLLLGPTQTGFVPGRWIGSNVSLLREVFDFCSPPRPCTLPSSPSVACAFLDFEKAYDRIDRDVFLRTLACFGFGPVFCAMIATAYADTTASISFNGWLSSSFPVRSGVRQGDPSSPGLFNLVLELLCTTLTRTMTGLPLPDGARLSYSAFADDVLLFIHSQADWDIALAALRLYEQGTGSRLNHLKCEVLYAGSDPPLQPPSSTFRIIGRHTSATPTYSVRYLGVPFGSLDFIRGFWQQIFAAARARLFSIPIFGIHLTGIVLLIQSCVLAKFTYVSNFLPPSPDILDLVRHFQQCLSLRLSVRLQGVCTFARSHFSRPRLHGGLGIGCPRLAAFTLLVQWIRRLFKDVSSPWCILARFSLSLCCSVAPFGPPPFHLFGGHCPSALLRQLPLSAFWRAVITAWNSIPSPGAFSLPLASPLDLDLVPPLLLATFPINLPVWRTSGRAVLPLFGRRWVTVRDAAIFFNSVCPPTYRAQAFDRLENLYHQPLLSHVIRMVIPSLQSHLTSPDPWSHFSLESFALGPLQLTHATPGNIRKCAIHPPSPYVPLSWLSRLNIPATSPLWSRLWKLLWTSKLPPDAFEVWFLLVHRYLRPGSVLSALHPGNFPDLSICLFCGFAPESFLHVACDCPVAQHTWRAMLSLFSGVIDPSGHFRRTHAASLSPSAINVLFGFPHAPVGSLRTLLTHLCAEVHLFLWSLHREMRESQSASFHPSVPPPVPSLAAVTYRFYMAVRSRISSAFSSTRFAGTPLACRRAHALALSLWGANQALCWAPYGGGVLFFHPL